MNKLRELVAEIVGMIKPLLAAAIAVDQFLLPLPKVDASTGKLALATLLIFAGR